MEDKDLLFLKECKNEQLKLLTDFIVYDKDGQKRLTENLSTTKDFQLYYPQNMLALLPSIINELQRFGGNTFVNGVRGHGVCYRTILEDVCDLMKVNYPKAIPTGLLEQYLLQKFLLVSVDKMAEEDIFHLSAKLTKEELKNQIMLLKAGSPLFIRMITMLIGNLAVKYGLKQGAAFVAKFAGGRLFSILTGPIGWIISGIWAAFDIAGPAYRVTVPCTLTIAYLRNVYQKSDEELNEILK